MTTKFTVQQVFVFFFLSQGLVFWPVLNDPLVSQNPGKFYTSHSILRPACFSYHISLIIFNWNLRDGKSLRLSRTLLSILSDFKCAEVWMVQFFLQPSALRVYYPGSWDCFKNRNYDPYHYHIPQLFQSSVKAQLFFLRFYLHLLSLSFNNLVAQYRLLDNKSLSSC